MTEIPHQRICIFGTGPRRPEYSRNILVHDSLEACDVDIVDCTAPLSLSADRRTSALRGNPLALALMVVRLAAAWAVLLSRWRTVRQADAIWVPYPAHIDVVLAAIIRRPRQRIYMDAFISLYDTVIVDRGLGRSSRLFPFLVRWWERMALNRADVAIMDTPEHVTYLRSLYPNCRSRLTWLPAGIDAAAWSCDHPSPANSPLRAILWSTFIPLHGVEVVVNAARLCHARKLPIQFVIYGDGQIAPAISALMQEQDLPNLEWNRGWFTVSNLRDAACAADICLGIFGTSRKAASVIPYKVQQALCAGRPTITARTPASARLLSDRESAILCDPGDAESLTNALEWCIDHRGRLDEIGRRGRRVFDTELSASAIRLRLRRILDGAET